MLDSFHKIPRGREGKCKKRFQRAFFIRTHSEVASSEVPKPCYHIHGVTFDGLNGQMGMGGM